jgi:hypothetical protein
LGIFGLILFEIANVYFIMPMPGSQEMNSIDLAYFLYKFRWIFRAFFIVLTLLGAMAIFKSGGKFAKVAAAILLLAAAGVVYATNFMMAADTMFVQPGKLQLTNAANNTVDSGRLVLGVEYNGVAKAYPIQYLGYHHQVFDTIAGKPVIVTYCTVCRTGRVFEPVVNGKTETFRLVGMDHFNAMFEDSTTHSWWRQATGEAITGKLKGQKLPEYNSTQMVLKNWLSLYPHSLVMQPDTNFRVQYDSMSSYEKGKLYGKLTRRDTLSWQAKSWVVGITTGAESKTYDWKQLEREKIIYDVLNDVPLVIILGDDNKSFTSLQRINAAQHFTFRGDTLSDGKNNYRMNGAAYDPAVTSLKRLNAYQEYWHSWQTFHPNTKGAPQPLKGSSPLPLKGSSPLP